jgi:hypothetical protein
MDYLLLKGMTDIELILLHHEVADSEDASDKDFSRAIQKELKLRYIEEYRWIRR